MATAEPRATNPCVSIGLPTYNRMSTLREAIESVLGQSHSNLELVISDNASSDDTQSVCEEYAGKDSRVRYIRQLENIGMARNFNAVLSAATSDFFIWISDDDRMDARYIELCLSELLQHKDYAVACCVSKFYRGDEFICDGESVQLTQDDPQTRVLEMYRTFVVGCFIYGLYRRESLSAGWPEKSVIAEDIFFVASVLFSGKGVTVPGANMHRSSEGVSSNAKSISRAYGIKVKSYWRMDYLMAQGAGRDVRINPAYEALPAFRRRLFAAQVFRTFWFKFIRGRVRDLIRWWKDNARQSFVGNMWRAARRR